jgi:hypothetical protein
MGFYFCPYHDFSSNLWHFLFISRQRNHQTSFFGVIQLRHFPWFGLSLCGLVIDIALCLSWPSELQNSICLPCLWRPLCNDIGKVTILNSSQEERKVKGISYMAFRQWKCHRDDLNSYVGGQWDTTVSLIQVQLQ